MFSFNSILFKLLREANGLTQKAFSEKYGFNQALVSKWEGGLVQPTEEVIVRLAEAFRYPVDFLMQPMLDIPTGLAYHRKRSALRVSHRSRIEAQTRLLAFDAVKICSENGVSANILERDGRTPEEAANDLKRIWNVGRGPVKDFIRLLENNGVVVIAFDFGTDLIDGFFLPVRSEPEFVCIALNLHEEFSPDRQRFTLAHELGHAILHRREFVELSDAEDEANRFASEFLLPSDDVRSELSVPMTFTNLMGLKRKWQVSMGALLRRARDLGCVTESVYRRTCVYLSTCGYRRHEPEADIPTEEPQLVNRLLRQMLEDGKDVDELLMLSKPRLESRYSKVFAKGEN